MSSAIIRPLVAIACGGTGGHLFPGLAVAEALQQRECEALLLISSKEVDQQAVKSVRDLAVVTLPAVGLERGRRLRFAGRFLQSYTQSRRLFRARRPQAVLAMGGFTSAPPVWAAPAGGTRTFLHEANSIPGRANRWLAPWVNQAFVFFPDAARRLRCRKTQIVGMPVRSQFEPLDPAACRAMLGLEPQRPVLLVMGGSQGAAGINRLVTSALPIFARKSPELQFLHLTGPDEFETVRAAYAERQRRAVVHAFLTEMELALGAATVAISRAGASSLAELAALRVPSILIPFPAAADNHQWFNARAFTETGAAQMLSQAETTPEHFAERVRDWLADAAARKTVSEALARWHSPNAAAQIADVILATVKAGRIAAASEEPAAVADAASTGGRAALLRNRSTADALDPARQEPGPTWFLPLAPRLLTQP